MIWIDLSLNTLQNVLLVCFFSAYKHVRSEKDIYSAEALIQNNALHAKKLLDLLAEFPSEEYFCVSTDKAANPVNIMGASKRIMEDYEIEKASYYSNCILDFPCSTQITGEEIAYVADSVKRVLSEWKRLYV